MRWSIDYKAVYDGHRQLVLSGEEHITWSGWRPEILVALSFCPDLGLKCNGRHLTPGASEGDFSTQ